MTQHELLGKLSEIIDETKTGVLATVDTGNLPHVRWMTPTMVRGREGAVFAVTCPDFRKVTHLKTNRHVIWMFQSRTLDRVVHVRGAVNVVDNPSLKNEVLEVINPRLDVFWRANCESSELVVIETVIEEATYYEPLSNIRDVITFK